MAAVKRQRAPVQRDLRCARQNVGTQGDEHSRAGPRECQPGGGAHRRQQYGFRQQLADEACPSRAERTANAHLAAARGRPREQQIGQVHAGDQQDESHGRRQGQ